MARIHLGPSPSPGPADRDSPLVLSELFPVGALDFSRGSRGQPLQIKMERSGPKGLLFCAGCLRKRPRAKNAKSTFGFARKPFRVRETYVLQNAKKCKKHVTASCKMSYTCGKMLRGNKSCAKSFRNVFDVYRRGAKVLKNNLRQQGFAEKCPDLF